MTSLNSWRVLKWGTGREKQENETQDETLTRSIPFDLLLNGANNIG